MKPKKNCYTEAHIRHYKKYIHTEKGKAMVKKFRQSAKGKAGARRYRQKLKCEVMAHYCKSEPHCMNPNCLVPNGCRDIRCLSIDHINGGGCKHITEIQKHKNFYLWLREHDYPDGYQVLCMNCQWIKRDENKECGK